MFTRYDLRPDPKGWTVFDLWTGAPVAFDRRRQEGLSLAEADALADLLNSRADRRVREILQ